MGDKVVGVVGLGIMGGAMAKNLITAEFEVLGHDIRSDLLDAHEQNGGRAVSLIGGLNNCDVIITSLPSINSFHDVLDVLADFSSERLVVIDTSTLPIEEKVKGHETLNKVGKVLLDCPVSGTGSQALTKDLVVLGSGDRIEFERCASVFDGFARAHRYLGRFGNGSKMKFVANHLVNIHNVAAAEAMVLGMKAGLDPKLIYDTVKDGAGNSRIFELRAPMMVAGEYDEASMKIDVWQKDLDIISDFAASLDCPAPLFDAAVEPYRVAMDQGLSKKDTAAVCSVLEKAAGMKR
ncbi:MAG: oxidoreductase [Rhodospirillaceae bacterium]|nr:oxidoreductase [Rhodospirillaceae bacterium]